MLIAHVLPLSCHWKKLQNLSHLNCGLQICQYLTISSPLHDCAQISVVSWICVNDQSIDWLIDRLIDWLIDRLIDRLIDWLIDWLIYWAGTGVTTYSLHPGAVETGLSRNVQNSCIFKLWSCYWKCCRGSFLSPEDGARTTLYCCLEPSIEHESGLYYR